MSKTERALTSSENGDALDDLFDDDAFDTAFDEAIEEADRELEIDGPTNGADPVDGDDVAGEPAVDDSSLTSIPAMRSMLTRRSITPSRRFVEVDDDTSVSDDVADTDGDDDVADTADDELLDETGDDIDDEARLVDESSDRDDDADLDDDPPTAEFPAPSVRGR